MQKNPVAILITGIREVDIDQLVAVQHNTALISIGTFCGELKAVLPADAGRSAAGSSKSPRLQCDRIVKQLHRFALAQPPRMRYGCGSDQ